MEIRDKQLTVTLNSSFLLPSFLPLYANAPIPYIFYYLPRTYFLLLWWWYQMLMCDGKSVCMCKMRQGKGEGQEEEEEEKERRFRTKWKGHTEFYYFKYLH